MSYEDYYVSQAGSGLSVFAGARRQRGHGFMSGLLRLAAPLLPMLKRGVQTVLKKGARHALQTGLNVLSDVESGKPLKESAIRQTKSTINRMMHGGGRVIKRKRHTKKVSSKRTRHALTSPLGTDIYS